MFLLVFFAVFAPVLVILLGVQVGGRIKSISFELLCKRVSKEVAREVSQINEDFSVAASPLESDLRTLKEDLARWKELPSARLRSIDELVVLDEHRLLRNASGGTECVADQHARGKGVTH